MNIERKRVMNRHLITRPVTRRSALAGLGASGLGLALANAARPANAQDASPDLANHPVVGAWRAITPGGPSLVLFHPDGSALFIIPANFADPQLGVVSQTAEVAVWEPTGERSIHYTSSWLRSDATGTFLGFSTVEGYPNVSEDGQTLNDDLSQVKITNRDADGVIVEEISPAGAPPVVAYRMTVGSPGFPEATSEAGTPTT
jgi:hypothetical protein